MRRSCQFCRSRKIRCSGHNICTACSERRLDCVYGAESGKGRPRGSVSKNLSRPSRKSPPESSGPGDVPIAPQPSDKSVSKVPRTPTPAEPVHSGGMTSPGDDRSQSQRTMGSELIHMFDENFGGEDGPKTNVYQNALSSFNRRLGKDPASMLNTLVGGNLANMGDQCIMSYDGLLSFMTLELVEMVCGRFGSLGCHNSDDPRKRFYILSLARDHTPAMFESAMPKHDPLAGLDDHRILQMIEIWFSVHPLSTIISKTLLLRDIRTNNHDPCLLAVILADAGHAQSGHAELVDVDALFAFAAVKLYERPASAWTISTAQALLLFGWHELCVGHARRATCYIGYAGRISTKLNIDLSKKSLSGQGQINGVDIGAVETELVQNIYWMAFAITLWSFMQMDQPFSFLLPKNIPTAFPSMDESTSALIKLDIASNNISTLQGEAKALRELWPLSHITSTIAHIYALYPRHQDPNEPSSADSWQNRPIHQLRQLLNVHQDVSALCSKLIYVLLDAIKSLDGQVRAPSSKTVIVIAYHTMIIHMLFPRQEFNSSVVVTEAIIEEFCKSAQALLDIGVSIEAPPETANLLVAGLQASTVTDTFALGLEVSGRAMKYLERRLLEGSLAERELVYQRRPELYRFANVMHSLIQGETVRKAKRFQVVKRTLKQAKLCLRDVDTISPRQGMSQYPSPSEDDSGGTGPEIEMTTSVQTPLQSYNNDHLPLEFDSASLNFSPLTADGPQGAEPFPIDWFNQFTTNPQMQGGMLSMPKPYHMADTGYGDPFGMSKTPISADPAGFPPLNDAFDPLANVSSFPGLPQHSSSQSQSHSSRAQSHSRAPSEHTFGPPMAASNATMDIDDVDSD